MKDFSTTNHSRVTFLNDSTNKLRVTFLDDLTGHVCFAMALARSDDGIFSRA
jgi:hypothetical protein